MEDSKAIVLFDGICNLCNASVNFIIKHDKKNYFRFMPLQSAKGKELLKQLHQDQTQCGSLILIENHKIYKRSTGALRILRKLNGLYFLLYVFILIPPFLRDAIYNFIAKNRYKWFGKKDSCMMPNAEVKDKFIV